MVEALTAFYRVKKQRYKDRVYYYLYREWYDPSDGKRHSKLIGRCDILESVLQRVESGWCGGWDLNPRRPTPAGLEPSETANRIESRQESFYHSDSQVQGAVISGRTDVAIKLTEPLISEFSTWLKSQGTGEKTVKNYTSILSKCVNIEIANADDFFRCVKLSKKSYEAFSRFLTFYSRINEELAERIRKTMPKKPKSGIDTKVPSDEEIIRLKEAVAKTQNPVLYSIYNILVSSGCRLSEAYALIKTFNEEKLVCFSGFCRYHMDYLRGSKNVYVLYMPREVVEQIKSIKNMRIPHISNIVKKFEKCGLGAKYIRKWFRQTCKKLRIDSEVIEFIQGRVTGLGIGAKHYTDLIALSDEEYTKILQKIKMFLI